MSLLEEQVKWSCGGASEMDMNKLNIVISIFIEVTKKVTLAQ